MEREVFPSPDVRAAAEDFVALKINVDDSRYADICRTWQQGSAVPSFVVLGADGAILDEWSGALEAEPLAVRLLRGKHLAKVPEPYRERWGRATRRLLDGDVQPLRELIAVLDHAGEKAWARRLSLMECREHYFRYRWSLCMEACELTLRRFPGTTEAERLRARARFRGTGVVEPETAARVRALIDRLDEPWPRFGSDEERTRWGKEQNGAVQELIEIGEPAVDALMEGLLEGNGATSKDCARALGRIRDPRVMPELILAFEDRTRRNAVRARIAAAMDAWCDPAFLPVLVRHLDDPREPASVRAACAEAIGRIGRSHGGLYGATVVEPIFRALDARDPELRRACLAALREVRDEFDLARLYPAMGDDRATSFASITVAQWACGVFVTRAGQRVRFPDGTPISFEDPYPDGTDLFLKSWWETRTERLSWDPELRRYVASRE